MPEPVEPNRIRALADSAHEGVVRLTAEMEAATTDKERKVLRKQRKLMRSIERFARTRAGYR